MLTNKKVRIKALKYPNIPHYEWEGEILDAKDDYVVVLCKPGRELQHHTKGKVFTVNNYSIELFSLKHWFTISCQIENGNVVSYYCNIAKPSVYKEGVISYVDLDLDLVKKRYDFDFEVVDEDEFVENSKRYAYSLELIRETKESLKILQDRVKNNLFPFDGTIEHYIPYLSA